MSALKYYIQTGLDSLEASRQKLLDQLIEIDGTMAKPRDDDVERVRYCPKCYGDVGGRLCVHCELDELFQVCMLRIFTTHGCLGNRTYCGKPLIHHVIFIRHMRRGSFSKEVMTGELYHL